jgi:hypothetical protein
MGENRLGARHNQYYNRHTNIDFPGSDNVSTFS